MGSQYVVNTGSDNAFLAEGTELLLELNFSSVEFCGMHMTKMLKEY